MTAHNKAKKEEAAPVVLMSGDPLRAKWIAETRLQDARLINDVRGMLAYTGTYKGKRLTVAGHGMGIPSIGIYSYEYYKFYDVHTIIRTGSCGSYSDKIKPGDVIIANAAFSYSTYAEQLGVIPVENKLSATPALVTLAEETAKQIGINTQTRNVFSSDVFYNDKSAEQHIADTNCLCVEMEAFGLYANARCLGKNALTLLTCSDSLVSGEAMSAADRERSFNDMIKLALELSLQIQGAYEP